MGQVIHSMIQRDRGGGKGSERPEIVLWTSTAIYKILIIGWILMFMVNIAQVYIIIIYPFFFSNPPH